VKGMRNRAKKDPNYIIHSLELDPYQGPTLQAPSTHGEASSEELSIVRERNQNETMLRSPPPQFLIDEDDEMNVVSPEPAPFSAPPQSTPPFSAPPHSTPPFSAPPHSMPSAVKEEPDLKRFPIKDFKVEQALAVLPPLPTVDTPADFAIKLEQELDKSDFVMSLTNLHTIEAENDKQLELVKSFAVEQAKLAEEMATRAALAKDMQEQLEKRQKMIKEERSRIFSKR